MIETRNVAVCDACGHTESSDANGDIHTGYTLTITDLAAQSNYTVYACKRPQIGRAARNVLNRHEGHGNLRKPPSSSLGGRVNGVDTVDGDPIADVLAREAEEAEMDRDAEQEALQ